MQARPSPAVQSHWPRISWQELVLWLAVGLFVFQVALHASTPAQLNMAEWLSRVIETPVAGTTPHAPTDMAAMPGMPDGQAQVPANLGRSSPGRSGHAHHAEGLCCMPPVALLPTLWIPPPLPLSRQTLTPPKAVHEALRILRATARGPPVSREARFRAV